MELQNDLLLYFFLLFFVVILAELKVGESVANLVSEPLNELVTDAALDAAAYWLERTILLSTICVYVERELKCTCF